MTSIEVNLNLNKKNFKKLKDNKFINIKALLIKLMNWIFFGCSNT